jgi:ribonuclease HI
MPFYAVHKGKRRGIYTDWAECKQNIFGVRHPIFKKFNTKEEAETAKKRYGYDNDNYYVDVLR